MRTAFFITDRQTSHFSLKNPSPPSPKFLYLPQNGICHEIMFAAVWNPLEKIELLISRDLPVSMWIHCRDSKLFHMELCSPLVSVVTGVQLFQWMGALLLFWPYLRMNEMVILWEKTASNSDLKLIKSYWLQGLFLPFLGSDILHSWCVHRLISLPPKQGTLGQRSSRRAGFFLFFFLLLRSTHTKSIIKQIMSASCQLFCNNSILPLSSSLIDTCEMILPTQHNFHFDFMADMSTNSPPIWLLTDLCVNFPFPWDLDLLVNKPSVNGGVRRDGWSWFALFPHRVTLDLLSVQANTGPPWRNKSSVAFWRGRDSRQERLDLVRLSRKHPDLIDAKLTNMFFFKHSDDLGEVVKHVSFFDFFKVCSWTNKLHIWWNISSA